MRIYIAAYFTTGLNRMGRIYQGYWNERERAAVDAIPYILESYHYVKSAQKVRRIREDKRRIFLDSGAYSAFSLGKQIDIQAYCQYIHENRDIIDVVEDAQGLHLLASVLDSIGDAAGTWRNQQTMEQLGIVPLPCYHYGEPEEVLCYYAERFSYITIGGMVPISTNQLFYWLDRIWGKYLTQADGTPKIKVHGFGLTSMQLMRRYPWYSVDSSSWVQTASNGGIMLPGMNSAISVSTYSPNAKKFGQHYNNLPKVMQERVRYEVESRGFSMERMQDSPYTRFAFNCLTFTEIQDDPQVMSQVFKNHQPTIF